MRRYDAVVVGGGFGGSILCRALNRQGLRVALVERQRHPRFALGESSTPLAALSLERLAADHDLPDLRQLAAYGRWRRHLPALGCGLKRGFTFYDHQRGDPRSVERSALLVAASPDDAVADTHWLRADVDHFLLERARDEGVEVLLPCQVAALDVGADRVTLECEHEGRSAALSAGFLVDATGAGGLAREFLGVPDGAPLASRSGLLFAHFAGVETWDGPQPPGPYPAQRAAVHHLVPEGWIYELRFDDGRTSAGALLRQAFGASPAAAWSSLIARHPALAASYRRARALMPIAGQERIQRRLARAAGPCWALLPHTLGFVDPLFSTGIAWTLRGVERLAAILGRSADPAARDEALETYETLLQRELEQIDALVAGAYAAMPDFELFAAYALTYFAAVSFAEVGQRLLVRGDPAWDGFLGVGDPALDSLFHDARAALPAEGSRTGDATYRDWVLSRIAPRDVVGLDRYGPRLAVPVDLEVLLERPDRLGLDRATLASRLPLLRGDRGATGLESAS